MPRPPNTPCLIATCAIVALAGSGCASLRHYKIVPDSVAACRDFHREGLAAMEVGDGDRARELLDKAVASSPTDVDARRQLAEMLWQEGRHQEAIEHVEAAVKLEPHHAPTIVRAGELYFAVGQANRALSLAERSLTLDRSLPSAWALRGRVYRQRRQYNRALGDLQRALQYSPDQSSVLLEVAELHYEMGRPQRTLTTLHHLLDRYPSGEEPQRALWLEGLAFSAVERPTEAAASLLAATQRGAPHPELLYRLARAEAALGRPAAASEAARQALAVDGRHAGSRQLLAELQAAEGAVIRR
ncbi:tetratricopeptide repeat protein [Pirellulales bacterium]|nr:tetratricopeptide repeat protein [Pirellulales bacterium]